jgi:hypothetical protein
MIVGTDVFKSLSISNFHSSKSTSENVFFFKELLINFLPFDDLYTCFLDHIQQLVKKDSVGELLGQSHSSVGTSIKIDICKNYNDLSYCGRMCFFMKKNMSFPEWTIW